jgi:hypothetical protein
VSPFHNDLFFVTLLRNGEGTKPNFDIGTIINTSESARAHVRGIFFTFAMTSLFHSSKSTCFITFPNMSVSFHLSFPSKLKLPNFLCFSSVPNGVGA